MQWWNFFLETLQRQVQEHEKPDAVTELNNVNDTETSQTNSNRGGRETSLAIEPMALHEVTKDGSALLASQNGNEYLLCWNRYIRIELSFAHAL